MSVLRRMALLGMLLPLAACQAPPASSPSGAPVPSALPAATVPPADHADLPGLPGMPPPLDPSNVYAAAGPGMLAPQVRGHRELVYVPQTNSDDVSVIDPKTMRVIDRFPGGPEPQHVVPAYDLRTLYVAADRVPNGSLTPIDPATGQPGKPIAVQDPYNLYFTPDGRFAIVVAEYYGRLDLYDPTTWQRVHSIALPGCAGANHLDFSADGRTALVACEFNNAMVVIDVAEHRYLRRFDLDHPGGMPQDTRLAPDGTVFYVADMMAGGVYVFDGAARTKLGFLRTGKGAHGIYFSRDAKRMFVTNRSEGSVSVLDPVRRVTIATWRIPGGSPDMGALSPDGNQLWLSGRYHNEVYVLNAASGALLARIKVGSGPHGLLYWPQPGRYSLGHTANIR